MSDKKLDLILSKVEKMEVGMRRRPGQKGEKS